MVQRIWSIDRLEHLAKVLSGLFLMLALMAANSGLLEFRLWPQVEYLYEQFGGIGWQQLYQHPHSHRYQLVSWIYELSEVTGIDRHILFSNLAVAVLALVSWVTARTVVWRTQWPRLGLVLLACMGFYFTLALFMNGRLIIGLLGVAWLLTLIRYFNYQSVWKIALVFVGTLMLSGVTSGVFLSVAAAAFSAVLYAWLVDVWQQGWRLNWLLYGLLGLIAVVFLPIVHMMLFKNLNYFDGDIVKVAEHGLGQIITNNGDFTYQQMLLNLVWASGVVVMLIYFKFMRTTATMYHRFDNMLLIAMLVLITLSIFAYSIVSMSVVFSLSVSLIIMIHVGRFWRRYA